MTAYSSAGRRARVVTAGLVACAALVLNASPAHAADEISIDHVESADGDVSVVLSVDGVASGSVDPDRVSVEIDGRDVDAEVASADSGQVERTTVVVLDTSLSMGKDGKFEAAAQAFRTYLNTAPDDVSIGLVTFAQNVIKIIEPTSDHASLATALDAVELRRGTSVYDAVRAGVKLVGDEGSRSLLVLSDGADTSSDTTLSVAINDALEDGVIVDTVSLGTALEAATLGRLSEDTGGAVIPADTAALSAVFTAQADALSQQLLLTFRSPAEIAGEATITVSARVGDESYVDSAFVTLDADGASLPQVVDHGTALVSRPMMLAGAFALFLGLLGLLITVLSNPGRRSAAERRIDAYLEGSPGSEDGTRRAAKSGSSDLKESAVAITSKVVSSDMETRISQRLAGAGSALTAAEWILLHAAIAVGSAAVGMAFGGIGLCILALLGGAILPWLYLRLRHKKRLAAFNAQLAEALGMMAGGLQAGLSLPQAVDTVVREGHEPMAGELRRALVEQRLGVDITDALDGVGQRMKSEDFGWVVMAIRIQREVGGNLAEILNTVADTLREREYLRRQVRSLSAEGRLSGYILGGMPPALFVYLYFVNNEYVRPLYTTIPGFIMLGVAAILLGLGGTAMSKMAKVEV